MFFFLVAEPEKCFKDCYHYFPPSECSCHLRDGVPLRQGNVFYDGYMSIPSPVFQLVEADFFFRCGVSGAITSSCLPRAVISSETVSRLGAATTSSTGTALVGVLRWPVKLVGVPAVCMAREPVVMCPTVIQTSVCADCKRLHYGSTGCWSSPSPGIPESAIMKFSR